MPRKGRSTDLRSYAREVLRLIPEATSLAIDPNALEDGYFVGIPPKRWADPKAKYNVYKFAKYRRRAHLLGRFDVTGSGFVRAYCNGIPAVAARLGGYLPYSCDCKTTTCKAARTLVRKAARCGLPGSGWFSDLVVGAGVWPKSTIQRRIRVLSRLSPVTLKYLSTAPLFVEVPGQSSMYHCVYDARTTGEFGRCAKRIITAYGIDKQDDDIVCRYLHPTGIKLYGSSANYRDAVRALAAEGVSPTLVRWAQASGAMNLGAVVQRYPTLVHRLLKTLRRKSRPHYSTWTSIARLARDPDRMHLYVNPLLRMPWRTERQFNAAVATIHHKLRKQECRENRVLDRYAQRNPKWAINLYERKYKLGKEAAPILGQVLEHLRGLHKQGFKLFFHGRDGELLAQLAHCSGLPVRYAVTSRPLTTEAEYVPKDYLRYLEKACPKGDRCAHVDTGYSGSIPEWMWRLGWSKKGGIHLVSSRFEKYQIPMKGIAPGEVNRLVYILEHNIPMRLEDPEHWHDGLCYSKDAPGWWAVFYGAADALGIPYCPSFLGKGKIRRKPRADHEMHGWPEAQLCC
jgi:hypothetical protein